MSFDGDRERTIYAMVVARTWKDPQYRAKFISNPAAELAAEGIELPPGTEVRVVQDEPGIKYLGLSHDARLPQDGQRLLTLFEKLIPIPAGTELRLVQSTAQVRYVVIPAPPARVDVRGSRITDLVGLAADGGVEATYTNTTQSVEAETTEVTVTETTEVQDAETSTTVVAEAELVAT